MAKQYTSVMASAIAWTTTYLLAFGATFAGTRIFTDWPVAQVLVFVTCAMVVATVFNILLWRMISVRVRKHYRKR